MNEPLSRYEVTVTVTCDGGHPADPAVFTAAAERAAWSRSASIISAHLADKIISVVTVTAPDRYAAVAVARAVVSDAYRQVRRAGLGPPLRAILRWLVGDATPPAKPHRLLVPGQSDELPVPTLQRPGVAALVREVGGLTRSAPLVRSREH